MLQVAVKRRLSEHIAMYAHSLPGPKIAWELLVDHHARVAERAAGFAAPFGWGEVARVAGFLHDIGKCSPQFQAYIGGERKSGGDHSAAGARVAQDAYGEKIGRMLAFIIAGHHAGLPDADRLDERLVGTIPPYEGWQAHTAPLPAPQALANTRPFLAHYEKGFETAFLIRILFSCLVDADSLETEEYYAEARNEPVERRGHSDLAVLRDRLRAFMAGKRANAPATDLNALRREVLDHAVGKAEMPPGLFTLTVPTGGGKTLASLSFALEHAVQHGLERVVYVIPFTSIIEQTAAVFRDALQTDSDILEHHASFDWERLEKLPNADDEGADALRKLRRASENWDVPIVVTTAVQFFESLYANKRSRCRKLHNLTQSVMVLDEAQTMPVKLLRPCLAALDELSRNCGASVVLCTATQPAVRKQDDALVDKNTQRRYGLDIPDERELAPTPQRLYEALKRVEVERLPEPIEDEVIAERFAEAPQMLCIVNSRLHARKLFAAIRGLPGAVHLTTLMCPRHRRLVLADLRRRLADGNPVRLVATSLIEAGVDIDFPEVWRASTGIDSIAQAAGRCNREGGPLLGRVVVFDPVKTEDIKRPPEIEAFEAAARAVFRHYADPLTLDAVRAYFHELYFVKGMAALDAAKVEGRPGILPAIATRAKDLDFRFESVAEAFRMIENVMEPVIVPWRAGPQDNDAETLLRRIAGMEKPLTADLRRLQQYVVAIPPNARTEFLKRGALKAVHPNFGDALLAFKDIEAIYDPDTGVILDGTLAQDFII